MTLRELVDDAVAELRDWRDEHPHEEPHDQIFGIADQAVPCYHGDLLRLASENLELATTEPEIIAYDGRPTVINLLAGALFEYLEAKLWEAWQAWEDEEAEDDAA